MKQPWYPRGSLTWRRPNMNATQSTTHPPLRLYMDAVQKASPRLYTNDTFEVVRPAFLNPTPACRCPTRSWRHSNLETTVMVLVYPHQRWMWPWLCESLWLNMAHCPAWVVSSFVSRWSMWSSKPGAYSMFYTFELWATNLNGWLSHSNPRIDSIPYPTHIPFISHFSTYKNGYFSPRCDRALLRVALRVQPKAGDALLFPHGLHPGCGRAQRLARNW